MGLGDVVQEAEALLSGNVSVSAAERLGTFPADVSAFIEGTCSPRMAEILGIEPAGAQAFRNRLTEESAAAFLIGLLAARE